MSSAKDSLPVLAAAAAASSAAPTPASSASLTPATVVAAPWNTAPPAAPAPKRSVPSRAASVETGAASYSSTAPATSASSTAASSNATAAAAAAAAAAAVMTFKKRKKTLRACLFCQRSHMPCDSGRPCERCIKRGLSDQCRDGTRKKSKYLGAGDDEQPPLRPLPNMNIMISAGKVVPPRTGLAMSATPVFVSDALNREFTMLGDIVTAPLEEIHNSDYHEPNGVPEMGISAGSGYAELSPDFVYDRVTEPYSYAQGFHHLLSFAKQRMDKEDMLRICKALVRFRPSFMSTVKTLSRQDLVFMEKCFQRTVLEFNKLLTYIGTPTCVWRRTGVLALVGKEFSLLTQWSIEDLLGKSTFIYELMDNRSTVEYWEKYASVVLDNSQTSVITKCTLIRPDRTVIPCTVCYTIKRDIFDVPLCVVGNFLPILNSNYRL